MKTKLLLLALLTAIITIAPVKSPAQSPASFSDSFAGPSINPALQDPSGDYIFNGVATNIANARTYISTLASNFSSYNFTALLTYTISTNGDSAFFGIGSGVGDTNFYGEPLSAIYLRSDRTSFGSGGVHVTINNGSSANEGANLGNPGDGTSRALITESNGIVTFAIDPNSSSGPFVSAYSESFNLSTQAPFLNATNSTIFFGSAIGTVFNSLTVSVVPEPSACALFGLGVFALIVAYRRREKSA